MLFRIRDISDIKSSNISLHNLKKFIFILKMAILKNIFIFSFFMTMIANVNCGKSNNPGMFTYIHNILYEYVFNNRLLSKVFYESVFHKQLNKLALFESIKRFTDEEMQCKPHVFHKFFFYICAHSQKISEDYIYCLTSPAL